MAKHLVAFVLIIRITPSLTLVLIWIQQRGPHQNIGGGFPLKDLTVKLMLTIYVDVVKDLVNRA